MIDIQEEVISSNGKSPKVKFGLTEAKRKSIFKEIIQAEMKAQKEAYERVPWRDKEDMQRSIELQRTLPKNYEKELEEKHSISSQVIEEIENEGADKQWPFFFPNQ